MGVWRFQITNDRRDNYRWLLVNPAGTGIYQSSNSYATSALAARAAARARDKIAQAAIQKA